MVDMPSLSASGSVVRYPSPIGSPRNAPSSEAEDDAFTIQGKADLKVTSQKIDDNLFGKSGPCYQASAHAHIPEKLTGEAFVEGTIDKFLTNFHNESQKCQTPLREKNEEKSEMNKPTTKALVDEVYVKQRENNWDSLSFSSREIIDYSRSCQTSVTTAVKPHFPTHEGKCLESNITCECADIKRALSENLDNHKKDCAAALRLTMSSSPRITGSMAASCKASIPILDKRTLQRGKPPLPPFKQYGVDRNGENISVAREKNCSESEICVEQGIQSVLTNSRMNVSSNSSYANNEEHSESESFEAVRRDLRENQSSHTRLHNQSFESLGLISYPDEDISIFCSPFSIDVDSEDITMSEGLFNRSPQLTESEQEDDVGTAETSSSESSSGFAPLLNSPKEESIATGSRRHSRLPIQNSATGCSQVDSKQSDDFTKVEVLTNTTDLGERRKKTEDSDPFTDVRRGKATEDSDAFTDIKDRMTEDSNTFTEYDARMEIKETCRQASTLTEDSDAFTNINDVVSLASTWVYSSRDSMSELTASTDTTNSSSSMELEIKAIVQRNRIRSQKAPKRRPTMKTRAHIPDPPSIGTGISRCMESTTLSDKGSYQNNASHFEKDWTKEIEIRVQNLAVELVLIRDDVFSYK